MKILNFNYKKESDAEPRERFILSLKSPFPDYAGYDLSDLPEQEYCELISQLKNLQKRLNDLIWDYDLEKSYRRFKPDKMTDVTVIDL